MLAVTLNGKKYSQQLMWLFWAIYFTQNLNEKEFRLVGKQNPCYVYAIFIILQ